MEKKTYRVDFSRLPFGLRVLARLAAAFIVLGSMVVACAVVVGALCMAVFLFVLSVTLDPLLRMLGRRGMWRQKDNGKTVLALDAEAFKKRA